ncbi:MAG: excinuclease ABC subunit B [Parcubacteria group bacterium CG11_big_fil_rev_8_21_14_0_20_39_22]|nr:MAG: excinuclease ABC subunit B [Parcubacteria group bacterium CG11_big_fil_rev_8_21_14_0_20_39_22]
MDNKFKIKNKFSPAGDQPKAIASLYDGLKKGLQRQTLLGATGTGKTFTVANLIEKIQKPTLVIAHNKTLAAQLAGEYRDFFPDNTVHYFVSYYDYYQPEAYMPVTDTYIEKEAMINDEIDRLRHASTQALLTRKDVIIVASVSCIYGLGSPEEYEKENKRVNVGMEISRNDMVRTLISLHYNRTNADLEPGLFRAMGNRIEIMPVNERIIYLISIEEGKVNSISEVDPITRVVHKNTDGVFLFPAKHFVTDKTKLGKAIKDIREELAVQINKFESEGKIIEAERIKRRTRYDLAMLKEVGYVNGIENYSRHLSGKKQGEAPDTLLSYFPRKENGEPDFLTVIDESHVTVPQIGGMYEGDASRKRTLIEHGFRLPSAADNRPLKLPEFEKRVGQVIYTSATPGKHERNVSEKIVQQIIRPTGLVDPKITVLPIVEKGKYKGQIADFIERTEKSIKRGGRVLATTLTKKMAEDLSEYLKGKDLKVTYLHSDIDTIERIEILTKLRKGEFDCLVGVNLLREGLDLPEVELIGILDADKEGFLRSDTALIQTIGRAARNINGHVILYADRVTGSMERAIGETQRRRDIQIAYNKKNGITPKTIEKEIHDITESLSSSHGKTVANMIELDRKVYGGDTRKLIRAKKKAMEDAVKALDFETAGLLRDEIRALMPKDKKAKKTKPKNRSGK